MKIKSVIWCEQFVVICRQLEAEWQSTCYGMLSLVHSILFHSLWVHIFTRETNLYQYVFHLVSTFTHFVNKIFCPDFLHYVIRTDKQISKIRLYPYVLKASFSSRISYKHGQILF